MTSIPSSGFVQDALRLSNLPLLLGVGGLLIYLVATVAYKILFHPLRSYPGPLLWRLSSLPADYHSFNGTMPFKLQEIHLKYGDAVRIGPDELSFANSKAWKDIYQARNPEFPKDIRRTQIAPNGYYSILNAPKDEHGRFRRLLAHAFSEKGLREQEPRIRQYMDLLVDRLNECAQSKQPTNIVDWYTSTVFDVIGDLAWGESFGGLENRQVHEWVPAVLGNTRYVFRASALQRWGLGRFKSWLVDQNTLESRKKNFALAAQKAEKRAAMGGEPQGDFWDRVLIKSADDNSGGEGMVKEEMINNAAVLVLGGAETSATTLSGATYLLLKNPEIMKKLVHEVRSTFKSSDDIDVYSVNRLPYQFAVLEETMRLYPPVPDQAQRIPPLGSGGFVDGKYIPELTTLHVPQIAANFLPQNFTRPWDFVPERWLDNAPAEFANDDKAAFQPFAVGNRNCIGKNLAYAEMRLVLAKVLWNFDLELEEGMTGDWWDQKAWGVWWKGPLWVRVRRAEHRWG